jgi:ribosome-binding protein aMBF1 (putative translation factor)
MGRKRKTTKKFDSKNSTDSAKRLDLFDEFTRELGKEIEKRGLTEEQLMAELEETKREVFEERYGKH